MQMKFGRKKCLSKNDSSVTLARAGCLTSVCDRAANAHAFPQSSFVHWDVTVRVYGEEEEQERKEEKQSTVDNFGKILVHLSISFPSDLLRHKNTHFGKTELNRSTQTHAIENSVMISFPSKVSGEATVQQSQAIINGQLVN